MPIPKAIREAPQLLLGLEFVYSAFWELSSCRHLGMGAGPIPWTEIQAYAKYFKLSEEECQDFSYLIRSLDRAYLEFYASKEEKKAPKKLKQTSK